MTRCRGIRNDEVQGYRVWHVLYAEHAAVDGRLSEVGHFDQEGGLCFVLSRAGDGLVLVLVELDAIAEGISEVGYYAVELRTGNAVVSQIAAADFLVGHVAVEGIHLVGMVDACQRDRCAHDDGLAVRNKACRTDGVEGRVGGGIQGGLQPHQSEVAQRAGVLVGHQSEAGYAGITCRYRRIELSVGLTLHVVAVEGYAHLLVFGACIGKLGYHIVVAHAPDLKHAVCLHGRIANGHVAVFCHMDEYGLDDIVG